MDVVGYKKKSREELIKEIDSCVSINQLFAIVQHENIKIQMQPMSSASNIPQKRLEPKDFIPNKSPLDRLKDAIKAAI